METLCLFPKSMISPSFFESPTFSQNLYFVNTLLRGRSSQQNDWEKEKKDTFFCLIKIAKMVFIADCDATNRNNEKICKRATLA